MSEAPLPPKGPVARPTRSAARAIASEEALPPRNAGARFRSTAENWGLNLFSIGKDAWAQVRRADLYTKLKAGVLGLWAALAIAGVMVACPQGLTPGNSLGAELILAGDSDRPIYMIRNSSSDLWEDVTVVVNGDYRLSVPRIEAGRDVTFGPKQLLGPNGALAPTSLTVTDVELRTDDDEVRLMREGRIR